MNNKEIIGLMLSYNLYRSVRVLPVERGQSAMCMILQIISNHLLSKTLLNISDRSTCYASSTISGIYSQHIAASRIRGLPFFRLELRLVFRTRKKGEDSAVFNKQPGKGSREKTFFLFFHYNRKGRKVDPGFLSGQPNSFASRAP